MLNKNTLGVKSGQSEVTCKHAEGLISAEAKKLLYLNDIQWFIIIAYFS